ncbi:MAG: aspartate aminotransferase family protein [Actinobacteria bacterium]|nr:aspartate aminotransferase family protein [Actinomycetota bacterium]
MDYDKNWAKIDPKSVPDMKVPAPGPKAKELHERAEKYMKGYSSQVKLFPVSFESGHGVTLTDVDGNKYIDFSSGIYVTNLGHCHPKVVEYIQKHTARLMNCHDFTTEVKVKFLEKLVSLTPGNLNGVQMYCAGCESVEAAMRAARAQTKKYEFFSFYGDFHGKTMAAVSLTQVADFTSGPRAAGYHLAPGAYCYRCAFDKTYPGCNLFCVDALEKQIKFEGTGNIAGIVLEPIQGWGGSIVYPDDYLPALRKLCDKLGIFLIVDEVLTCCARTGKMWCVDHYDVIPDIIVMGKGLANGFPCTAFAIKEEYTEVMDKISASTSYGGNPMAAAAGLASLEVIEEENIVEKSAKLGDFIMKRLKKMKDEHKIIGEVRGKGCLLGMELVKDRDTKEPFIEAGKRVYQVAFSKGLAWIPANQNLRMSPPLIMEEKIAEKALEIIDESITIVEKELGYGGSII